MLEFLFLSFFLKFCGKVSTSELLVMEEIWSTWLSLASHWQLSHKPQRDLNPGSGERQLAISGLRPHSHEGLPITLGTMALSLGIAFDNTSAFVDANAS